MTWEPAVRVLVVKVATPALSVPLPKRLPLSRKFTEPVGVGPVGVTVAVNLTAVPCSAGFVLALRLVVVVPRAANEVQPLTPSNLLTSMEPQPVASSNPAVTRYPARPPVR